MFKSSPPLFPPAPSGRSDVHNNRLNLRHLLVALPPLLRLRVPQQPGDIRGPRANHLPGHLLARHVQRDGEPRNLLLDERQVSGWRGKSGWSH